MKRRKSWLVFVVLLAASLLIWKLLAGASALSPVMKAPMPAAASLPPLVNAAHPVSGEPARLVQAYPEVAVRETSIMLDPEALEALAAMFAQAKAEGIQGLYLSSGYRDYNEQKRIYDEAKDKRYVQPPGHSEHQTGLAADILALEVSQDRMGGSKQGKWLAKNAWRWGFILRYPKDKESLTGIAYEPWHFRYVGLEHARYCYENNLCLEEYLKK